jgi:hypothetical protein
VQQHQFNVFFRFSSYTIDKALTIFTSLELFFILVFWGAGTLLLSSSDSSVGMMGAEGECRDSALKLRALGK